MTTLSIKAGRAFAVLPKRVSVARREFSALVRVDDEFPGLPSLSPEPAKATSISVSTLASGLTVISEDACTTSTVLLTYPKAGSSNELVGEVGAAFVNKCMNFKSGSGISTIRINRTIENEGGFPFTSVNRFGASLGYSVEPDNAIGLIPLLATDCTFEKWDVRDAKADARKEVAIAGESAQIVLTENLFAAAYGPQSPAGRPLYSADASTDAIVAFRQRAYGINGAILAATGIKDHSAFCTEVAGLLESAPAGNSDPPAAATYLGGESRVATPHSGYAHVALAFQGPSSSVLADVIKKVFDLLGKESSVSGFSTPGLVGVYGGGDASAAFVDPMCSVVTASLSPDIVKRAKNLAKAEALFALDGGSKSLADFMTAMARESVAYTGPASVVAAYDAVTEEQVKAALADMLKSKPSLAAVGDISAVPYHATIASRFA